MDDRKLRVVVLTERRSGCAARITHRLARVEHAPWTIVGAVLDEQVRAPDHRRRRMRTWRRQGGLLYAVWRSSLHIRHRLPGTTKQSSYPYDLESLGKQLDFPVERVADPNSPVGRAALKALAPDVTLSIENRILGKEICAIPPLGILNVHYGRIPDFRGIPPAFWELHDGAESMSVTVHRVDRQLDHGDVIAARSVPIMDDDDAQTLFERALTVDWKAVEDALTLIATGSAQGQPVDWSRNRLNTLPTPLALWRARRRRGLRIRMDGSAIARLDEIAVQPTSAERAREHESNAGL